MARTSVEDPLDAFRYRVEIDGFQKAGFSECSEPKRTTEKIKYREGGMNATPQLSAGITEFDDVVLKRGQVIDASQNDFYNWAQEVEDATAGQAGVRDYRRDVDIVQYERGDVEVVRWRLLNAWPAGYKGAGPFSGLSNDKSIEELTLAYEGFHKVS